MQRRAALNFVTDLGQIDLLGEVSGIGGYDDALCLSSAVDVDGTALQVLDIEPLLHSKRSVGHDKDKLGVMHLEAVQRKQQPPS